MKSSTKRIISLFISILALVGTLMFYSNFVEPAYNEIQVKRGQLAGRVDAVKRYQAVAKKINDLLSKYNNVSQIREEVNLILPIEVNIPLALNQFTGLAEMNKLKMQSIDIKPLAVRQSVRQQSSFVRGIGVVRLSSSLVGDYDSLKNFIKSLETNINLMDLVNLNIGPIGLGKGNASSTFVYNITVDTYYQADK
jgi:hypothetical protein